MKKRFLRYAILAMVLSVTALQSKAILFTDLESVNQKLTATGPVNSYSGTFNILDDGFEPGNHNVWAAGITFWIYDEFDEATEGFTINLDGSYSTSQFTSFLVLGTSQVAIDLLASLNSDGVLSYNITATSGDFWLMSAFLFAEATGQAPETRGVPDNGSTLILAALALIGLVFIERRISKRA